VDNALEKTSNIELAERIRQYQREMYRLSFVILKNETDAQDAVSETIVKAFESKDKLKDKDKLKQWLMKILVNVSKTMIKNRQRLVLLEDTEQLDSAVTDSPDELLEIVMQLEEEFRTVVVLYYYQCFSTKEISWMMKVPEGTVKSRLARAREKLKVLV
jgi:RNA polymerase sigma-70 factor (ECF subfamily)